jgi:hypothetical protein
MKIILAVILLSCAAMAQNDAAIEKAKSACGPGRVHFDVEAADYTDSIIQPVARRSSMSLRKAQSPLVSD